MLRHHLRSAIAAIFAVVVISVTAVAADIDTTPLNVRVVNAFPKIKWTGWDFGEDSGMLQAIRPILLTHANDKSGRIFVPTQQGVIHILDKGAETTDTKIFLDLTKKVSYSDKSNEEGFLGMAFHPKYAENGQFFVYYTNTAQKHQNIIARYRVSKSDPNVADPDSEEILLTLDKPFWNHDGGTIVFGPDGYLYVAVGDGGLANDPYKNGQNLNTLLGKILRLDVDKKGKDTPYAIPADNPFAGQEGKRGEIWAYGLRNVWRMAFDPATKVLWAGDVGQDVWEEIDLIVKGGNYGWNPREGLHQFVRKGGKAAESATPAGMIDPIFEYHHDVGKSITGGLVYRGKQVPDLVGSYLYADYVSGKVWALRYDEAQHKVTANREIATPKPILTMSFGEDGDGEAYFMTYSNTPESIYRFEPAQVNASAAN
jgi:glucose/arabinose dehydrogenase